MYLIPKFENIPVELTKLERWVVWNPKKIPFPPSGASKPASVTDPKSWGPFQLAVSSCRAGKWCGVGLVLNGDGLVGIDLDDCVRDLVPDPRALKLLDRIGCTYIELSPSRTGLRGFGYGAFQRGFKGELNGLKAEIYGKDRYLTVTGHCIGQRPRLSYLKGIEELVSGSGHVRKLHAGLLPESPHKVLKEHKVLKPTEDDSSHSACASAQMANPQESRVSSFEIPPSSIPKVPGERNACLFDLARHLKQHCSDPTRAELREVNWRWYTQAEPFIGTKDPALCLQELTSAMKNRRVPHNAVMNALIAAAQLVELRPEIAQYRYGDAAKRLLRLCTVLQLHYGDAPFFLSARSAGAAIGLNFSEAAKILRTFVDDELLVIEYRTNSRLLANRYKMRPTDAATDEALARAELRRSLERATGILNGTFAPDDELIAEDEPVSS